MLPPSLLFLLGSAAAAAVWKCVLFVVIFVVFFFGFCILLGIVWRIDKIVLFPWSGKWNFVVSGSVRHHKPLDAFVQWYNCSCDSIISFIKSNTLIFLAWFSLHWSKIIEIEISNYRSDKPWPNFRSTGGLFLMLFYEMHSKKLALPVYWVLPSTQLSYADAWLLLIALNSNQVRLSSQFAT